MKPQEHYGRNTGINILKSAGCLKIYWWSIWLLGTTQFSLKNKTALENYVFKILISFMGWHSYDVFLQQGYLAATVIFFILPRDVLKLVPSHINWSYAWPNFTDLILWFSEKTHELFQVQIKTSVQTANYKTTSCSDLLVTPESIPSRNPVTKHRRMAKKKPSATVSIINDAYEFKWPKFFAREK